MSSSREINRKSQFLFPFVKMVEKDVDVHTRALDKREYLMIFFLISHRNHIM